MRFLNDIISELAEADIARVFSKVRRASYIGVLSVAIFSICWIVAAMLDGSWVYGANMVSDLGVSAVRSARVVFEAGCIAAGIGFAGYGYSIMSVCSRPLVKITYALCMVCGFCLIGVGLFNELSPVHIPCALTLGIVATIAVAISTIDDIIQGNVVAIVKTALISVIVLISLFFGVPFAEATMIICLMAWILVKSSLFIKMDRI